MALNAASHNPTGERTGPVSGFPPDPSEETTAGLQKAASSDPMGQHEGGKDQGTEVQDAAKSSIGKSEAAIEEGVEDEMGR